MPAHLTHGSKLMVAVAAALWIISAQQRPSAAAGPITIRLATLAPRDTSYHRLLLEMGEKWRKASAQRVALTVFPGGNQGSEADTVRRMRINQLQAAMLSVGGLTEIDPGIAALQEIPMLFRSLAEEEHVRERLRPELEKRLLAKGFVALFWGDSGWVRFFSREPAVRPADFKRMKIFVTASGSSKEMEIMQALGYKPVAIEWSDVLTSMQTRMIDAVPTLPTLALAGQYYVATKHMTEVNWVPLVGAAVMTKQAWETIPEDVREALLQTAAETGRKVQDAGRLENEQAVDTMKKKLGLEVHAVPADVEQEWRAFAESVYPKIRGSLVPADVFDRVRQLVDEYRAGRRAGE
jgi:TRAP-type transport system periplasmic protein